MTQKREGTYKDYNLFGKDFFKLLPPDVRKMIDETEVCLNCGKNLKHNITVEDSYDKRENRGYCCQKCAFKKPPKIAYVERVYKKPMLNILLETLNKTKSVRNTASLLGFSESHVFKIMNSYKIKKFVMWEVSQYEKTNQKRFIERKLESEGCTKEVLEQVDSRF